MRKVALFSVLLIGGLIASQTLPGIADNSSPSLQYGVSLLTVFCVGFIMIHVGYEFEVDRPNLRQYVVDYGVAATAAAFPWIFCALYFVFVMGSGPPDTLQTWKESLLVSRFAAPTSAGVLFSMCVAPGLAADLKGVVVFHPLRGPARGGDSLLDVGGRRSVRHLALPQGARAGD